MSPFVGQQVSLANLGLEVCGNARTYGWLLLGKVQTQKRFMDAFYGGNPPKKMPEKCFHMTSENQGMTFVLQGPGEPKAAFTGTKSWDLSTKQRVSSVIISEMHPDNWYNPLGRDAVTESSPKWFILFYIYDYLCLFFGDCWNWGVHTSVLNVWPGHTQITIPALGFWLWLLSEKKHQPRGKKSKGDVTDLWWLQTQSSGFLVGFHNLRARLWNLKTCPKSNSPN